MGIHKEEVYFPRGRSSSKPALRKTKDTLFKKFKKTKKKRSKKHNFFEEKQKSEEKKKRSIEKKHTIIKNNIRPLTYQSLEEGIVVVGRIREIWPYHMFVCLPGRLSAKLPVSAISAPYTQSLSKLQELEITQEECPPLSELFSVGQSVVCSVVEVVKLGNLLSVTVSLEPELVNRERGHQSVRAGHVLMAAVSSVEDHGYTLHTGITGLTAFLHRNKTARYNQGRPLVVGEVIRCLVIKCTTTKSSSRIEVTVEPERVARAVSDVLQPASAVKCIVEQTSAKGLVVTVEGGRGYIEASQLAQCWSSPKHYTPQSELTASVLYNVPHTDFQSSLKLVYLTLRNINECVTPKIALGTIIQGMVISTGPRGITLCLGDKKDNEMGNKGFVSVRRLGEHVEKDDIATKFPKGKLLVTRILAFDYMEQIYNCSIERSKLEQQYLKLDELSVADRVTCEVSRVDDKGVWLMLGSIKLLAVKQHSADVPYSDLPKHFSVGDIVDARVLKVKREKWQVNVTLKETLIRSPALVSYEEAHVGDCYWGTVTSVFDTRLFVAFYGDVYGSLKLPEKHQKYSPGQLVKCFITYVNPQEEKLMLSLTGTQAQKPKQLSVGEMCELVVSGVGADHLIVSAVDYDGIEGLVPKCHLQDYSKYTEGDFLKAWLFHAMAGKYYFSPNPAIKDFLKFTGEVTPHCKLTCCVANIANKNIAVYTPLPDFPVVKVSKKKWLPQEEAEIHQIVEMYVEQFDLKKQSLKLTRKQPSALASNGSVEETFTPLPEEKKKKVKSEQHKTKRSLDQDTEIGCSEVDSTSGTKKQKKSKEEKVNQLTTNTHSNQEMDDSNLSDIACSSKTKKPKDSKSKSIVEPLLSNSDSKCSSKKKGKCKNEEQPTNALSNLFDFEMNAVCSSEKQKKSPNEQKRGQEEKRVSKKEIPNNHLSEHQNEDEPVSCEAVASQLSDKKTLSKRQRHDSGDDCESSSQKKVKKRKKDPHHNLSEASKKDPKKLTLSESGFFWDVKPEDLSKPVEESLEDEDEDTGDSNKGKKKKSAAERRKAAKEEEARLREVEQTLLDTESNPQSVNQFDRAVLAQPDNADLWIKYMSHHLQATEIDKARAVARRALQTINQRHEVERLNVWIALLNLENLFGTQESLKSNLEEAVRTNDEFTVYSKMLQIYSQANKYQEAEQLVNTMLRKFRTSAACWMVCCSELMKCNLPDKARNILQRAITALPAKEHINLLCKFAVLENQHGYSEQAQTVFEHILTSYPKRTDVWNVYMDMLVKSGKVEVARQILERAARQKLPARKMKMLFSKWISFEEKHGTAEKVEHVRKQALAYVTNITMKLE